MSLNRRYLDPKEIVNVVLSSQQHKIIKWYANREIFKVGRHHGDIHRIQNSTWPFLNDSFKVETTEWTNQVDWPQLNKDILDESRKLFIQSLYDEYEDYYKNTLPYELSHFVVYNHIKGISEYGLNTGDWGNTDVAEFKTHNEKFWKMISYDKKMETDLIPDDYISWNEMLLKSPQFGVLRHRATSSWPLYKKQSVRFILENYKNALLLPVGQPVTLYARKQGGKYRKGEVIWKIRDVIGVPFSSKLKGMGFTYVDQKNPINIMPYYRSWDVVFDDVLKNYNKYKDLFIYVLDYSTFDKDGDSHANDINMENSMATMPESLHKDWQYMDKNDCNDPKIVTNALEYIQLGRYMNSSGSQPIPFKETAVNYTLNHIMNPSVEYEQYQIDDGLNMGVDKIDLKQWSTDLQKRFGYHINADKTETNELGYITFLQVHVGEMLRSGDTTYFGNIMRRVHRLHYKERFHEMAEFDYEITEEDESDELPVDQSRMLGTISSLSDNVPYEITDIIFKHLSKSDTFKNLKILADSEKYVNPSAEFTFNFKPQWVLDRLKEFK